MLMYVVLRYRTTRTYLRMFQIRTSFADVRVRREATASDGGERIREAAS